MKNELIERLKELRRTAYVDALMSMKRNDNVIGTFGEGIDSNLFFAFDLVSVPIVGVDSHIFKYGEFDGCDPVRSTMIYMKTDKCPLLYSSKAFVIKPKCAPMVNAFMENTEKPIHVYKNSESLLSFLKNITGKEFDESKYELAKTIKLKTDEILETIRESSISGTEFSFLKLYIDYIIDIKKRLEFLEGVEKSLSGNKKSERIMVSACCPRGIIEKIGLHEGHDDFEIFEVDGDAHYSCDRCVKNAACRINY